MQYIFLLIQLFPCSRSVAEIFPKSIVSDLQLLVSACFIFQSHHFSCGHTDKHFGSSLPSDLPDGHWFGGFLQRILLFNALRRALQLF